MAKKKGKDKIAIDKKKLRQEEKKKKLAKKKASKDAKEAGEDEIEHVLAEFMKKEAAKTAITVQVCDAPPSPRANFTLTTCPTTSDLILFGGEYFDGDVNVCYNELYRWSLESQEWRQIISPNSPPPRCSHQAVVYRDALYVFGGEFATADQFYHYRDFWKLDLKTNAWEAIECKGGPSPRSGHRMVVWRNIALVFGGFYEAFRETKWYNDLFLFYFAEQKWKKISFAANHFIPSPRSGCQLIVYPANDIIFLYGGYAKVKVVGQKTQGKTYSDMWSLNMSPIAKSHDPVWEKCSKKGSPPSVRSGASMTVYRNKAILFGGVFDQEGHQHSMQSTFYNDLYAFDMDRKRWYQLQLRNADKKVLRRRKKKKKPDTKDGCSSSGEDDVDPQESDDDSDSGSASDGEDENKENQFGYVDMDGNIVYIDNEEDEDEGKEGGEEEAKEEEEEIVSEFPSLSSLSSAMPPPPTIHSDKTQFSMLGNVDEEEEKECEDDVAPNSLFPPVSSVEVLSRINHNDVNEPPVKPILKSPTPRINPALVVQNHTLYIYGGVFEEGDREITLDDCWTLDMKRLDQWNEVLPGTMDQQIWKGGASDTEDSVGAGSYFSDEEDDEEDGDDEDSGIEKEKDDEGEAGESELRPDQEMLEKKKESKSKVDQAIQMFQTEKSSKKSSSRRSLRKEMESLKEQLALGDPNRTPAMDENLRDFFARTTAYWSQQVRSSCLSTRFSL